MRNKEKLLSKRKYNSIIDKINPATKLICYFLIIIFVLISPNFTSLFFVFIFLFILNFIFKIPFKIFLKTLKIILISAPILFLLNALLITDSSGEKPSFNLGNWKILWESVSLSFEILMKVFLLFFSSSIFILTSSEMELVNGIKFFIHPLKYLKVPINEIGLMISVALRYVPLILYESKVILQAQASRGLDYYSGNFLVKIRAMINIMNPLFLSIFIRTEELSNSLEIRGYEVKKEKSVYKKIKFNNYDKIILLVFALYLGFMIFLSIDNGNIIPLFLDIKHYIN